MDKAQIIFFIILTSLIVFSFILGIVLFFLEYRKKSKLYLDERKELQELHQKELLQAQLEIQQQTMQHIGREIHDSVGQKLTLASLYTQQLEFINKYPDINEQLVSIGSVINESLAELRNLSKSLTDAKILNISLEQLIQNECKKVDAIGNCKTIFNYAGQTLNINSSVKNIVLRIVQEFMQNSLKHSNCKSMTILFNCTIEGFFLRLQDDGKGFDTNASFKGIGLQNIYKRAAIINAHLDIKSELAQGTTLELFVPINAMQ